jgi:hypothetical protein
MTRNEVFEALKKRGYTKAAVHFSGGNDEGGVDEVRLHPSKMDVDGDHFREVRCPTEYDEATRTWKPTRPPTEDELLSEALGKSVYAKYGSFAGEFYVSDTVVWDAEARKVYMEGQEEVSHWKDFAEDVEGENG